MKKSNLLTLLPLLLVSMSSCGPTQVEFSYDIENVDNADGSAYYEVFVGEYADSNNDGIGDLNGLKAKLPYLKDLGVKGLWLMPIMPSPSYHKYDVKDYYDIDDNYGTMEDFDALVAYANTLHIDIIIDMVLNHSSSSNPWFVQSATDVKNDNNSVDSKKDWYAWSDTGGIGYNYNSTAKKYYESRFDSNMPEFNLDNEDVKTEFTNIFSFWLNKGVKGFRFDAVTYYYYESLTKSVNFMKWIKETCDGIKPSCYLIGEAWKSTPSQLYDYASSGMSVFNFAFAELSTRGFAWNTKSANGKTISKELVNFYSGLEKASSTSEDAPFISNHDQDRSSGYLSGFIQKMTASMYLLCKGHPFIYYGEEIGLKGKRPANSATDADRRLAMIWSSENDEYRCDNPVGATYPSSSQITLGANDNLLIADSLTNHYKKVLSIRNKYNNLFQKGSYENIVQEDSAVMMLKIQYNGEYIYLIHNLSAEVKSISLSQEATLLERIDSSLTKSTVNGSTVSLAPYSSVVLR